MIMNNIINRIRKWPIERKRIFSVLLAVFLTVLIIIFNFSFNSIWKDNTKNTFINNNSINKIQKSFSEIIDESTPILEQIFSTSSQETITETDKIIDQINSASSSLSTSSNVVN